MKEIRIRTSGHSRRCMNSVLTSWKKASILQLLINHKDQTLLLCAITVKENTTAFQEGSSTPSFSLRRTFFTGQAPSADTAWGEAASRQRALRKQCCRSCLNTAFTGRPLLREGCNRQGDLHEQSTPKKKKSKRKNKQRAWTVFKGSQE